MGLEQPCHYCKTRKPGAAGGNARFDLARPIFTEAVKIFPTGITPPSLCAATAAKPIDATHPHDLQSGLPPNRHGVIVVLRSAERLFVVSAKMQSSGL